jgi:ParB-like nuclease domain
MMPPPKSEKPATACGKPASESSDFGGALKFEANNPKSLENKLAQAVLDQPIGTPEIAIAEIVIAERHRQDMGDIAELAANIEKTGLLHPIVISPSGRLIAGTRRIRAFEALGRERIPVTIIDLEQLAEGEQVEP